MATVAVLAVRPNLGNRTTDGAARLRPNLSPVQSEGSIMRLPMRSLVAFLAGLVVMSSVKRVLARLLRGYTLRRAINPKLG